MPSSRPPYRYDVVGSFLRPEKLKDARARFADQKVVLGLVTSKDGALESEDDLKARIAEASRFVPLDQLYISPQCGFSSTEEGNIIEERDQWKKIALLKKVAEEVWG